MSAEIFDRLKLKAFKINMPMRGINVVKSTVKQLVKTDIYSSANESKFELSFLVIDQITENLPQETFQI